LDFGQSYSTAPMVLASMQSANGMQTATLRHQNLDGSGMEVKVEEEQSLDAETSHVNEAVGFLAITGGTDHDLVSDSEDGEVVASELIENGSISVDQSSPDEWHTVELKNVFVSPVVVMSPPSYNGGNPSTVRVRNVSSNSFEFQLDEWNYLDGKHMREDVHYVVFEAGRHNLGNGHEAEAGIVNGGSSFASVSFKQSFADTPVVFSQIVSTNDAGAAVTRQRNVTSAGFEVMEQGEQASPSHGDEQVAYVAITQGHGEIGTQSFSAELTSSGVNHQFSALDFGQSYSTAPMVLASMQSANGMHTATLRYQNLDGSGMEVKVEEEQSLDAETYHVKETIGYLAIDGGSDISLAKTSTGVDHGSAVLADGLPKTVELVGNYPNPFNPTTTIQYALPEGAYVRLEVFDVTGRSVSVVVDGVQSAGVHEARFDASGLASGLYMYRLETGAFTKTSPMILMK
ncbi:MAG: T9SS type A sorting domain-containing protein, partial [Rhodothermales bacterium]